MQESVNSIEQHHKHIARVVVAVVYRSCYLHVVFASGSKAVPWLTEFLVVVVASSFTGPVVNDLGDVTTQTNANVLSNEAILRLMSRVAVNIVLEGTPVSILLGFCGKISTPILGGVGDEKHCKIINVH